MPIKIPNDLPAAAILEKENIFIMDAERAYGQNNRPCRSRWILFIQNPILQLIHPRIISQSFMAPLLRYVIRTMMDLLLPVPQWSRCPLRM